MTEPTGKIATGQPILRAEDQALLQGTAAFTADISDPLLEGSLYAAFVRSPVAAGTVDHIDASDAKDMPGVVATLTGADFPDLAPYALPLGDHYAQPLLPQTAIGFAGQALAVVVAETAAQAADATEAVQVDVSAVEPMLDLVEAAASRPVGEVTVSCEHDQTRFDAEVVITLTQMSPRQLPTPIEGRSVAAVEADGRLLLWSATQTPHAFRQNLAKLFELETSDIRVIAPAVGGGFGGKVSRTAEEYLVPVLARMLGRPVRWNETRSEYFATATQGRGELFTITLAGDRDGNIAALRGDMIKDAGAYPLVGVMLPGGYTAKVANGCYDIGHVEFGSVAAMTNRPPTSAYRGAGRSPYIGALERTIDRFAHEVGMDPAEIRRRNLIRPEQMPYETPTGARYDEADYPGDLSRVLDAVGYSELREAQAQRRSGGAAVQMGIGISCYNHMTTGGGGEEAAVTVHDDGSAVVVTGTTSQGHGHQTTWAQIAADVLHIDTARITVVEGDTDAIATGVGAVGSRSLQTAGMAIHRASTELMDQARALAAEQLEASVGDIVSAADGSGFHVVGTPARAVTWADVIDQGPADEMTCGDFYDTEGRNTFPSGAHVAVVEVDTETGMTRLVRFVGVDDAGTLVNPMIVEGQLHGGIASAIGQVLGEVVIHDDAGNQVSGSLMDYPIPTADQLPSFELIASQTPSSFNALGFKGVGESGTVGATAAVHNAVVDAVSHLGVLHLDLPCTPERVWEAIRSAAS